MLPYFAISKKDEEKSKYSVYVELNVEHLEERIKRVSDDIDEITERVSDTEKEVKEVKKSIKEEEEKFNALEEEKEKIFKFLADLDRDTKKNRAQISMAQKSLAFNEKITQMFETLPADWRFGKLDTKTLLFLIEYALSKISDYLKANEDTLTDEEKAEEKRREDALKALKNKTVTLLDEYVELENTPEIIKNKQTLNFFTVEEEEGNVLLKYIELNTSELEEKISAYIDMESENDAEKEKAEKRLKEIETVELPEVINRLVVIYNQYYEINALLLTLKFILEGQKKEKQYLLSKLEKVLIVDACTSVIPSDIGAENPDGLPWKGGLHFIGGNIDKPVIVYPINKDYELEEVTYDAQICRPANLTNENTFFNLALYTGWLKWEQRYFIAKITKINEDKNTAKSQILPLDAPQKLITKPIYPFGETELEEDIGMFPYEVGDMALIKVNPQTRAFEYAGWFCSPRGIGYELTVMAMVSDGDNSESLTFLGVVRLKKIDNTYAPPNERLNWDIKLIRVFENGFANNNKVHDSSGEVQKYFLYNPVNGFPKFGRNEDYGYFIRNNTKIPSILLDEITRLVLLEIRQSKGKDTPWIHETLWVPDFEDSKKHDIHMKFNFIDQTQDPPKTYIHEAYWTGVYIKGA